MTQANLVDFFEQSRTQGLVDFESGPDYCGRYLFFLFWQGLISRCFHLCLRALVAKRHPVGLKSKQNWRGEQGSNLKCRSGRCFLPKETTRQIAM